MIEKWKAHRTESFLKLNTQSGSSMRQAEVRQKLTGWIQILESIPSESVQRRRFLNMIITAGVVDQLLLSTSPYPWARHWTPLAPNDLCVCLCVNGWEAICRVLYKCSLYYYYDDCIALDGIFSLATAHSDHSDIMCHMCLLKYCEIFMLLTQNTVPRECLAVIFVAILYFRWKFKIGCNEISINYHKHMDVSCLLISSKTCFMFTDVISPGRSKNDILCSSGINLTLSFETSG